MEREPPRPPELDLDDMEARAKAYAEHCDSEFRRAEQEYDALIKQHCTGVCERMHHWAVEAGRAKKLIRALANPLS